jgi:hypothetical protein
MASDHDNNYKRIARRAEIALGQDAEAQRAALMAISKMALAGVLCSQSVPTWRVDGRGCVCPPRAESTCRGLGCPRNPPMKQKYINGELVWTRG